MKSDVKVLEITKKDLKNLGGDKVSNQFKITIWGTLWRTLILWLLTIITVGIFQNSKLIVNLTLIFMFIAPFAAMIIPTLRSKMQRSESFAKLVEETKKINSLVKAIDINDQLVEAGNMGMSEKERNKAIEALRLAREDLVRALKTERILRENKDIVASNAEFFANNLPNLRALQVNEQATEFGKILSNALQVAVDVQEEMKKLVIESELK
jgi:hypothetical protein